MTVSAADSVFRDTPDTLIDKVRRLAHDYGETDEGAIALIKRRIDAALAGSETARLIMGNGKEIKQGRRHETRSKKLSKRCAKFESNALALLRELEENVFRKAFRDLYEESDAAQSSDPKGTAMAMLRCDYQALKRLARTASQAHARQIKIEDGEMNKVVVGWDGSKTPLKDKFHATKTPERHYIDRAAVDIWKNILKKNDMRTHIGSALLVFLQKVYVIALGERNVNPETLRTRLNRCLELIQPERDT